MISTGRSDGRISWRALASGMAVWFFSISPASADDGVPGLRIFKHHKAPKAGPGRGTLGYGPPGLHPGFQGFGLGFHPGYGYGGDALGTGAEGGYPLYGGPGYPHPWPKLQRAGGIAPFCYFGGPGFPTPEHPNFFGTVGPLAPDEPVVTFQKDAQDPPYEAGYGQFHGTLPYAESAFAPYATMAGEGGSASGVSTASPSTAPPIPSIPVGRLLGFDTEPFENRGLYSGLRVNIVIPGGLAEKAGLHVNDVILSINGYQTKKTSDLAWIAENAATDKILKMNVRVFGDNQDREVSVTLP